MQNACEHEARTDHIDKLAYRREFLLTQSGQLGLGRADPAPKMNRDATLRQVGPRDIGPTYTKIVLHQRAKVAFPTAPVGQCVLVRAPHRFEVGSILISGAAPLQPAPMSVHQLSVRSSNH